MNKKGFTLVELLAVITILAVIALITTPIIFGVIEDSRMNTFTRSVEEMRNVIDMDYNEYARNFILEADPYVPSDGRALLCHDRRSPPGPVAGVFGG